MPVIESYTTQVPLSSETTNIMLGTKLYAAPERGVYKFLGSYAAAQGTVLMDIWRKSEQIADGLPMAAKAGGPNELEDTLTSFTVFGGEQITVKLRETAGTATDPTIKMIFQATG